MVKKPAPNFRIVFVDDSWERFENFAESLPDSVGEFFWAATVQSAIKTLADDPLSITVVCLDHDLGEGECGCEVVDWITDHKEAFQKTTFICHSWNTAGAEAMHNSLFQAGLKSKIKPFVTSRTKHID